MAELDGWYLRGIWCATSPRRRCHCCFCKTLLSHLAASGNLLDMSNLSVWMDSVLLQYVLCQCRHFAIAKVVCLPKAFLFVMCFLMQSSAPQATYQGEGNFRLGTLVQAQRKELDSLKVV